MEYTTKPALRVLVQVPHWLSRSWSCNLYWNTAERSQGALAVSARQHGQEVRCPGRVVVACCQSSRHPKHAIRSRHGWAAITHFLARVYIAQADFHQHLPAFDQGASRRVQVVRVSPFARSGMPVSPRAHCLSRCRFSRSSGPFRRLSCAQPSVPWLCELICVV